MTLAKPALVPALAESVTPADSSRQSDKPVAISSQLDTPLLMNADTTRRFVPIYFCGEAVPIDNSHVSRQWMRTLMQCQSQREELYTIRKRLRSSFQLLTLFYASSTYRLTSGIFRLPKARWSMIVYRLKVPPGIGR
jgi:hypothetical protein